MIPDERQGIIPDDDALTVLRALEAIVLEGNDPEAIRLALTGLLATPAGILVLQEANLAV